MQKAIKYTIFKTKWGYFGLAGTEYELLQTHLPLAEREKTKSELLKRAPFYGSFAKWEPKNLQAAQFDKTLFKTLQEQIIAYFEGTCVNFDKNIPIILACPGRSRGNGLSLFARSVLTACRDITFGQTISYAGLAKKIGRATAARAVGNTLAKNPLPLIIPCHRVVCSDGQLGSFSAKGGVKMKKKMLELEDEVAHFDKKINHTRKFFNHTRKFSHQTRKFFLKTFENV